MDWNLKNTTDFIRQMQGSYRYKKFDADTYQKLRKDYEEFKKIEALHKRGIKITPHF